MSVAWNDFTPLQIADICKQLGFLVKVPEGINGPMLLWALAGNESSFGKNCKPRYEQSYFIGKYSKEAQQAALNSSYGMDGAKSYGPWQVMLVNAPGYAPQELALDLERAAEATIGFLNRMNDHYSPKDLEEIGQIYNGGHIGADVPLYVQRLKSNYEVAMP